MPPTEPQVYLTPNIREVSLDTLNGRLRERRDRRMLMAIETNQLKVKKLTDANGKDAEKFSKQVEKASKLLDQARELMNKADDAIHEASGLHNRMVLRETEIG